MATKMTYIDIHTNHKILKLGIKWALYTEKKPELSKDDRVKPYQELTKHHNDLHKWQQSRIVYLKEPEFKVAESIWYYGKQYEILENQNNVLLLLQFEGYTKLVAISDCSHYYPGQQYDGEIKYVESIEKIAKNYPYLNDKHKWQKVEKPEEDSPKYMKPYYIDGGSGGEEFDRKEFETDYTQFQKDVDKGIILAEITVPTNQKRLTENIPSYTCTHLILVAK